MIFAGSQIVPSDAASAPRAENGGLNFGKLSGSSCVIDIIGALGIFFIIESVMCSVFMYATLSESETAWRAYGIGGVDRILPSAAIQSIWRSAPRMIAS